jgi:hypothetical protein
MIEVLSNLKMVPDDMIENIFKKDHVDAIPYTNKAFSISEGWKMRSVYRDEHRDIHIGESFASSKTKALSHIQRKTINVSEGQIEICIFREVIEEEIVTNGSSEREHISGKKLVYTENGGPLVLDEIKMLHSGQSYTLEGGLYHSLFSVVDTKFTFIFTPPLTVLSTYHEHNQDQ